MQLLIGSGRISNSSEILWLSRLHVRMKNGEDPMINEAARLLTFFDTNFDIQG